MRDLHITPDRRMATKWKQHRARALGLNHGIEGKDLGSDVAALAV